MSEVGADIVIVGAGAAGCVLARRLADSGVSILLLEAGPEPGPEIPLEWRDGWRLPTVPDWGFTDEAGPPGGDGKLRRGRLVGGTSWLTRFAVRGAAADFDAWAARGCPGWSYADVLPAFRRAESDAEFGADPVHGDQGPIPITRYPELKRSTIHRAAVEALLANGFAAIDDINRPDPVGVGPMPMSGRAGQRVTTSDGYLPAGRRPAKLAVRADSLVDRVVIRGERATGVRLADGTMVHAAQVILAAGTYGSPTILLRSGIGPGSDLRKLGVRVRHDLPGVGANLADHPAAALNSGWSGPGSAGPILHSIATFRSSLAVPDGAPDLLFWITDPEAASPDFWLDPILLRPASRGSVGLRSSDPVDPPRITLPGLNEVVDVARLAEGYRLGVELANHGAIRRQSSGPAPELPASARAMRKAIADNAYSLPHVVGTCRMGPSPTSGDVVDAMGRLHGLTGVHVADASIIPDAPSGFPHLITIMVAERISELLLHDPLTPNPGPVERPRGLLGSGSGGDELPLGTDDLGEDALAHPVEARADLT